MTKISACFFVLVLLSSCVQKTTSTATALSTERSTQMITPSQPVVTPAPIISPTFQASTPTIYPLISATLTHAPSFVPIATQPNESVYIDPEGWYSINIPSEWQNTVSSTSFIGLDGFFETGYLPEMMFVPHNLDVCQWLANISTKNTYSVSWMGTQQNSCQLVSLPDVTPAAVLEVIENPSADFPHRFLYIKTDAAHFGRIANTFTWLRPTDESVKPTFDTASLRPEDTLFWENTAPLPPGFSVTEYKLPPAAQAADPGKAILLEFIPSEARPTRQPGSAAYSPDSLESVNEMINRYGYELRTGAEMYLYDLYKYGVSMLKNIYPLPEVHLFATSGDERLVFFVQNVKDLNQPMIITASYLVQNETISLWENGPGNPMNTDHHPIWVAGELLILGLGDHTNVQVRNSQHNLVFSFETYFGTHIPIEKYQAWDNHWILEVSDFVVQDGEILNAKFGFEEIFYWSLRNDKPFFFFRKGPRAGISYDHQFLSVYYHEIIHGYCCGLALNNPMIYGNTIRFFGKRDGVWYYVVLEIK